jgi:hypothetical protein
LIENKFNVCGDENILRCIEYANGEWVWVIGDDDAIEDNCFNVLNDLIDKYTDTDVFFIHFNWDSQLKYKNLNKINDFKNLFSSIHSLGDLNFISSNIIKRAVVSDFIYWSHFYQSSATPITSLALLGLDLEIGSVLLSNEPVIINSFFSSEKSETDFWDVERVLISITSLANYPFKLHNKQFIINEIDKICTIWNAFKSAVRQFIKTKSKIESVYVFKEVLRLKLIYKNIFIKIYIEIISIMLYISIYPISKIFKILKSNNISF